MDRRTFLRTGIVTLAGSAAAGTRNADAAAQTRPNILIICVDQLRNQLIRSMPNNPSRPTIASLLPNITKLQSIGSPAITDPSDPNFNPGSGVSFTNYIGAATACTASRAAWVTGLYAPQTRMYLTDGSGSHISLNPGFPTWGSILSDPQGIYGFQSLGYKTAWIGKWHLSSDPNNGVGYLAPYGFSYAAPNVSPNGFTNQGATGGQANYGAPGQNTAVYISDAQITECFQRWFTNNAQKSPWCATVSYVNPHDFASAPLGFGALLDPANAAIDLQTAKTNFGIVFPIADNFPAGGFPGSVFDGYFSQGGWARGVPNWEDVIALASSGVKAPVQGQTTHSRQTFQALVDAAGVVIPFTDHLFARIADIYLWLCAMVDAQIGAVLNTVWSNTEILDNTMIVFTSDHGDFGGAHGMLEKNGALYDEGISLPLSVWFPYTLQNKSQPANYRGTRNNPCSAVDFCPMILSLASGNENWRQTSALAHLANRQALRSYLGRAQTSPYTRLFTLSTTDELLTDENLNYKMGEERHLLCYRDAGGKYVQYSQWLPCMDTIDESLPPFIEFYDYANGNTAEMGNDAPTSPNTAAYAQNLAKAIAAEFILPPANLAGPYAAALQAYLTYGKLLNPEECLV